MTLAFIAIVFFIGSCIAVIVAFFQLILAIMAFLFQCLIQIMPYVFMALGYIFMGIIKVIKSIFYLIISIFRKDKEHRKTKREQYFSDDLKRRYERYHDCEVVWDSNKKCYVPKR